MLCLPKFTILLLAVIFIGSVYGNEDQPSESEPLLSQAIEEDNTVSPEVVEEEKQCSCCCGGDDESLPLTSDSTVNTDAGNTMLGNLKVVGGLQASEKPIPESDDMALPDRPDANIVDSQLLDAYCLTAPKVSAPCSLRSMCQLKGENAPSYICGTTSIAALICKVDKDTTNPGSKELCADYDSKCTSQNCLAMHWPEFYSTCRYQTSVFKICAHHARLGETMRGCDTCDEPSTGIPSDPDSNDWNLLNPTCPSFFTYAQMCSSMPGMGACNVWRVMCSTLPNASKIFPEWCNAQAMHARNVVFNPALANIQPYIDSLQAEDKPSSASIHLSSMALAATATFLALMMM